MVIAIVHPSFFSTRYAWKIIGARQIIKFVIDSTWPLCVCPSNFAIDSAAMCVCPSNIRLPPLCVSQRRILFTNDSAAMCVCPSNIRQRFRRYVMCLSFEHSLTIPVKFVTPFWRVQVKFDAPVSASRQIGYIFYHSFMQYHRITALSCSVNALSCSGDLYLLSSPLADTQFVSLAFGEF